MKRRRIIRLTVKLGLFALTLILGVLTALNMGETESLARVDLTGASVNMMTTAVDGNTLYAEVAHDSQLTGLYRSTDNGRTWEMLGEGPGSPVNVLTVHSGNEGIFYAGGPGGAMETTKNLWRSVDSGRTWQKFNLNLPASPHRVLPDITTLAVDPQQPHILYVGTDGQGVYRFDDRVLGYELVGGTSLYNAHIKSLVVGTDSQLFTLTNEGLFAVRDNVWQKLDTPDALTGLVALPNESQTLLGGSVSTGVYRSNDGGQTWKRIGQGLDLIPGAALRITAIAVDEENHNHLTVATAYGLGSQFAPGSIYESNDQGENWSKIVDLDGLVTNLSINKGVIHAVTADGLVRYGKVDEQLYDRISPSSPVVDKVSALARPTGIQVAVLVLTVGLAGLILLNPMRWFERWSNS